MVFRQCGCRTYMSDHPNLFVPMVEYCPMHEAALDLLRALKAVDEWFEGDRKNEPKTWLELGKLVKQAIAKAKEKE